MMVPVRRIYCIGRNYRAHAIEMDTPENVGPVVRGDVIECHIGRLPSLSVKIV